MLHALIKDLLFGFSTICGYVMTFFFVCLITASFNYEVAPECMDTDLCVQANIDRYKAFIVEITSEQQATM